MAEPSKMIRLLAFVFVFATGTFAQAFTDFRFTANDVGWEEDFVGIIDNDEKTIIFTTQRWIEDIAQLRATFELDDDYEVKVGDDTQESGETQNDFRKEVVYAINDDVSYTVRFVSPQASGLPVIKIDTQEGVQILNKEDWISMTFTLSDPNDPSNDIPEISNQQIRGRGNSTWTYPKKPYRIRFRKGQEQSLFGLPAARNWVLLAEYQDPTFATTAVAFEIGMNIFQLPYTCSYHHVQMYLNDRYEGVYTLTEHKQVDPAEQGAPGRVKADLTDGWFVELDVYYDEEPKFITANYNLPIMIKSPEPAGVINMENPAYNFVRDNWNELDSLIASENFPENGYRSLINMDTFIDYLMVNEIVLNNELGHPKSMFAYKDKGGKINMGPLWDFDWAYGYHAWTHKYFMWYSGYISKHKFFQRLFEDPNFLVKYKERWNEKYIELAEVSGFIEVLGEKLRIAVAEDFKRWNIPNGYGNDYDSNHTKQINRMVNWYKNRLSWLNAELNKAEVLPTSKVFKTTLLDYPEISPQIFTIVSHGKMNGLTAGLQKGNLSDFEISTELTQQTIGTGGYFGASIKIKPKNSLPIDTYNDTLVLSGENQGKNFHFSVPLNFTVAEEEMEEEEIEDTPMRLTQTATGSIRAYTSGGNIILENLPPNAKIQIYSLQGKRIYSANHANPQILKIPVQTKGVYLVNINGKTFKVAK
jgi:hypothetical protein